VSLWNYRRQFYANKELGNIDISWVVFLSDLDLLLRDPISLLAVKLRIFRAEKSVRHRSFIDGIFAWGVGYGVYSDNTVAAGDGFNGVGAK
jgi:hypothetical protein